MSTLHELKIATEYYHRVCSGQKTFEIRKNDRDYQVGDVLLMREYDPKGKVYIDYSPALHAKVVYISTAFLQEGYCVLGIELISNED